MNQDATPAAIDTAPEPVSRAAVARVSWWQRFGNFAQIASAVVSLLGFSAVLVQISEIRFNNRAVGARQVYLNYMDVAFRNPKFSSPDYAAIRTASKDEQVSYENFVSYFLYACEEVTAAFATAEWQNTCDLDLKVHLPFLCEKTAAEPQYLATYAPETQVWIKSALQQSGLNAPDCATRKS